MLSVHFISLGCPKNRVDTERALGSLGPVRAVDDPKKAALVFINTCAFIAPAIEESVRVMMELIDDLSAMPAQKRPVLAVAGCLVGRFGTDCLAPDLPEADLLLDNRDMASWAPKLREALALRHNLAQTAEPAARMLSTGPSYAWLKISDGCRHTCSFCTIPAIRGALRSVDLREIRREASLLTAQGVGELVLVAQDLTAYGSDLGLKHGLKTLLEALLPLPGLERLRLMYLYPAGLTADLLSFLASAGPPFVPYFDVPLQHAAKKVLARMGRPFAQKPMAVIDRVRTFFPEAALRTSLIAGFPGESDADFEELRRFVAEVRFHHLGVFAYQAEEGTPAAGMPGQVESAEKERRRREIMALQAEISEDIMKRYVGRRLPVLVDAVHPEWPGLHTGRAWFQAPESDGITYVSGPGVRPGAMVEADIVESSVYDLTGLADADGTDGTGGTGEGTP
jgi:tRNA-2-methylthio-N6-dimethylallyladenosine synthase/ribosomal protein S12 methylthiotransferase